MLTGMEVGIVLAIIGAVVGEYLGGSTGLGHLAVATLNAFDVQGMLAVIGVLTVIGFALYFAVVMLRRFVTPWHEAVLIGKQADYESARPRRRGQPSRRCNIEKNHRRDREAPGRTRS